MTSNLALIERRPPAARSGHHACAPMAACPATHNEVDHRSRLVVALAPPGELGVDKSSAARHAVEMRARRMLEATIRFVSHPDFDNASATAEILGPMPGPLARGTAAGTSQAREELALSDADSQDSRFLTREQEVHLFRKMNFLKYQAAKLRETINVSRARAADLDRIEELLRDASAIRNRILRSYVGLVVSIVKQYTEPRQNFRDLVSDGNFSLIKASERFDVGRGARFSTYATWAITNNFARQIPRDRCRRGRFATGHDGLLQSLADRRGSDRAWAIDQEQSRYFIRQVLGNLDDREQLIIACRFGFAGDKRTLVQVGQELRISKERVRQLEARALKKLRTLVMVQTCDYTDESISGGDDGHDG